MSLYKLYTMLFLTALGDPRNPNVVQCFCFASSSSPPNVHPNRAHLELRFFGQAGFAARCGALALQLCVAVYVLLLYGFRCYVFVLRVAEGGDPYVSVTQLWGL